MGVPVQVRLWAPINEATMKKTPLTYKNMKPVIIGMMREIEDKTGLHLYYAEKEQAIAVMAPRGDVILTGFYLFVENGELILDDKRLPSCQGWLLSMLSKIYKKHRNKV